MSKTNSNSPSIQPLFDNVLVKPLEPEQRTASGILLPDTVKEKPQMGEVMAVGPGVTDTNGKTVPMQVTVGKKVLYKKWGGNEVKIDNKEYLFVKFEDVMATYGS